MAKMISPENTQNKSSLLFSFFCAAFFLSFIFIICSNGAAAVLGQGNNSMEKVSPWLMSNKGTISTNGFIVILKDQADLRAAKLHIRREDKARSVHEALNSKSKETQADLRKGLDERGIKYKSYSIVNMLLVYGDETLISFLAARPDVLRIEGNPAVRGIEPGESLQFESVTEEKINIPGDQGGIASPSAIEWNITKVRAPDVWSTFDITGTGIVVAGNDTGVEWNHPALLSTYRGWDGSQADHDYNWHDAIHDEITPAPNPCGTSLSAPCDDHGHGTHTLGTAVGDDRAANQIGVAPGAQWIACRNMESGVGTPATYLECLEFFLAPYPLGGNPSQGDSSKAPHVINNSWYCPPSEGCGVDTLLAAVENLRTAGIVVVVSAGNSGSACSTVSGPPAIYDASFSVGATDSSDSIASFSSRGPVTVDGSNRLKPNISAPGVGIRSSTPSGIYSSMSGTSMAAPHVAGAVALLWSAAPTFIGDVNATETLLEEYAVPRTTTQDCGSIPGFQIPNNTYGWGRLDIFAAVQAALHGPIIPELYISKEGTGSGNVVSIPPGIDCGSTCNANFADGTIITLTAEANTGSLFSHWSGGCSGTDETCQLTITGDLTVTATFSLVNTQQNKLKVSRKKTKRGDGDILSEDGAIICTPDTKQCSAIFNHGTFVTLNGQTSYPNTFLGWQPADLCPGTDSCTILMDGPKTVKGIFHGPNKLTVSIRSVKKGTGTVTGLNLTCPGECKKGYQKDEQIALIATAGDNSTFTEWVGCPLPSENACSINMDKSYKVKAVFTGSLLSE
jgi:serine protease AprX